MSEKKEVVTKADLIESVVGDTGLTKSNATAAVKAFLEAIVWHTQQGKKVAIHQFATFEAKPTKAQPAKTGRNPRTGEPVAIEAKPAGKRVRISAKFPAE